MALLCNAYWIDNDCSEACSLPKILAAAYGFNQNSDLDVTLPSASSQCSNFCASAKSNSSPNTYSIDSAALISSGTSCGGAGGSVQTNAVRILTKEKKYARGFPMAQTFEGYQPPENACSGGGSWAAVDSDGKKVEDTRGYTGWMVCGCSVCGPGGGFYREDGIATQPRPNNYKYVFVSPATTWDEEQGVFVGNVASRCNASRGNKGCTYDFETGTYLDSRGNRWATDHPSKRVE